MDEAFIERLYRELRPMAIMYARQAPSLYDADDLIQLALIKIIAAVERYGITDMPYLKKIAWNRMWEAITGTVFDCSLDAYLDGEVTGYKKEIADQGVIQTPEATQEQKEQVERMLGFCSEKQRMVMMASYGIADQSGETLTVEEVCQKWQITRERFSNVRSGAIQRIAVKHSISAGL